MAKKPLRNSKYTEDWISVIQGINNGMISLRTKEFVTGVKIEPRNLFILDLETQERTLTALKNFYNTIDYEFWLVVADRPVDISVYLSQLQLLYQNQQPRLLQQKLKEYKVKLIMSVLQVSFSFINSFFL